LREREGGRVSKCESAIVHARGWVEELSIAVGPTTALPAPASWRLIMMVECATVWLFGRQTNRKSSLGLARPPPGPPFKLARDPYSVKEAGCSYSALSACSQRLPPPNPPLLSQGQPSLSCSNSALVLSLSGSALVLLSSALRGSASALSVKVVVLSLLSALASSEQGRWVGSEHGTGLGLAATHRPCGTGSAPCKAMPCKAVWNRRDPAQLSPPLVSTQERPPKISLIQRYRVGLPRLTSAEGRHSS
jgi:hypothetical protein